MNLHDTLREAVLDPPPTGIDLDELCRKEHRRRITQRFSLAGAGLAVLSLTFVLVPLLSPATQLQVGSGPDSTPEITAPTSAPVHNATSRRLTAVLADLDPAFGVPPGTEFVFQAEGWEAAPEGWYSADWLVGDTRISISVRSAAVPQEDQCAKNGPQNTCERTVEPDGSVSYIGEDRGGPQPVRTAENYRLDNTAVMVGATGDGVAPDFTTEQLLTVAKLPGWSL